MRFRWSPEDGTSWEVAIPTMRHQMAWSNDGSIGFKGIPFYPHNTTSIRDGIIQLFAEVTRTADYAGFNKLWIQLRDELLPDLMDHGFKLPTEWITELWDKVFASDKDFYLYSIIGLTTTTSPHIQSIVSIAQWEQMLEMAENMRGLVNHQWQDATTQHLIKSVTMLMNRTMN